MLQVIIDRDKCINCLECVEVCPAGVLEVVDGRPFHIYTEHCQECGTCLRMCPEDAISVVKPEQ